jgi:hypothetical protein
MDNLYHPHIQLRKMATCEPLKTQRQDFPWQTRSKNDPGHIDCKAFQNALPSKKISGAWNQ